jgi:hypothetical protein
MRKMCPSYPLNGNRTQLDKLQNPGLSKEEMKWAKVRERKRQKRRKSQKKMGDVGKSSEEEEDI